MQLPRYLIAITLSFSSIVAAVDFNNPGVVCSEVPIAKTPTKAGPWQLMKLPPNGNYWKKDFQLTKDTFQKTDYVDEYPTGLQFNARVVFDPTSPSFGLWQQISKDPAYPNNDMDGLFIVMWYDQDNNNIRTFYLSHHDTCHFKIDQKDELRSYDRVAFLQY